jgi:hypothetical protein
MGTGSGGLRLAMALERIERRLEAIEAHLARRLTPEQWVKILVGIGLPLLVLLLTGSVEKARLFVGLG